MFVCEFFGGEGFFCSKTEQSPVYLPMCGIIAGCNELSLKSAYGGQSLYCSFMPF